jgi:hypothetical protein
LVEDTGIPRENHHLPCVGFELTTLAVIVRRLLLELHRECRLFSPPLYCPKDGMYKVRRISWFFKLKLYLSNLDHGEV